MDLPDKKPGGGCCKKNVGKWRTLENWGGYYIVDRYVDLIRTNAEFTKTNVAVTGTTINGVYFCWNNNGFSQAVQPGSNYNYETHEYGFAGTIVLFYH